MTILPFHLPAATAIEPYTTSHAPALAAWLILNLVSFAFEFHQWQQRRDEATKNDGGSFRVLIACAGAGLAMLVVSPKLVPGAAIQPAPIAFAVGMALFVAGFGMRRWSEMTLGRYFTFTVMTSADQPVVTSGPYRFVRHPGYTGAILLVIGAGLIDGNYLGLVTWTLLVLFPLLYRIHVEERALLRTLGDTYRSYAAAHKRLIPLIW